MTRLIILDAHKRNGHVGSNHTMTILRRRFFLLRGYKQVRNVLKACVQCMKHHGQPMQQMMSDLPKERVEASKPPFTFVGVDYFGPFNVKYRRGTVKRYGCLFTCLVTRAVHVEITHSLDSDGFIMALHRFMARRGKPVKIVSDNGTNFVGAEKELSDEVKTINSKRLQDEMLMESNRLEIYPAARTAHGRRLGENRQICKGYSQATGGKSALKRRRATDIYGGSREDPERSSPHQDGVRPSRRNPTNTEPPAALTEKLQRTSTGS